MIHAGKNKRTSNMTMMKMNLYNINLQKTMRLLQASTKPLISLGHIGRIMRANTIHRVSKSAVKVMQLMADDHMHTYFDTMGSLAKENGRVTVTPQDSLTLKEFAGCTQVAENNTKEIPTVAFDRVMLDVLATFHTSMHSSKACKAKLHLETERFIATWFKQMAISTQLSKCTTVMQKDARVVSMLKKHLHAYNTGSDSD